MLALGISISEEVQRRVEDGFISTQEYQEDERRREELLEDERRREEHLEDIRRREELLAKSRDMFEEEEEEEEEELRQSQYFPWTMTDEGKKVLEEDERRERERKRNVVEAFGNDNSRDDTLKMRFCGVEETLMPESRSEHVGKRPKPSVIMRRRYETVAEDSPERVIYSFTRSPSPFER